MPAGVVDTRGTTVTQPHEPRDLNLGDVAAEPPEESVAHEQAVVGDLPDTGGTVPPDDAQ